MIIEKASNKEVELLKDANFRHPEDVRASLDHDAIAHILKRHGVNSVNVRNGESPITYEDIANYRYIVNNADAILRTLDKYNKEAITAFKQINGYAVVVEQAINKKNELVLKTMFKSNGDYKNNNAYKKFSSTSLNANAKVPHRLSSYSGSTENNTQKPLTSQEDLLKTQENPIKTQENALKTTETTQTPKSALEQAKAEKLAKLESEQLESEKEFTRLKGQEQARKAALKKKLEHEQDEALKVFDSAQFFNKLNEFKSDVFTTPAAKEYIDIASGFHKLFKNDAKIAESLKPATTKNLSQGLATTLSGALKYQWTKFTLGTLYRNAPDRILGIKLPKSLNEATAGAALKYHIKRALERSHSISDFSKQLELSAKNSKFSNNTLKIIEELNNGVKQASDEIKDKVTKYEKALKELQKIDETTLTKEQQQVLKVFKGELDQTEIKGIDLNDLYILEQGSRNAGSRKILRKHYGEESTGGLTNDELINMSEVIKNGSVLLESFERIKNGFRYAYEWDNNSVKLRLVVDDLNNGNKIFDFYSDRNFKDFRDASLHSGNHPHEPNLTQNPLTSQEDLLKTSENLNETTQEAKNLSPLEQANAKKYELILKTKHKTKL